MAELIFEEDDGVIDSGFPKVAKPLTTFGKDASWVHDTFMIGKEALDNPDIQDALYYTSASRKWTDSSMGGNLAVGARPQALWYSDIRDPGISSIRSKVGIGMGNGNYGMGIDYSERIDDNERVLYMTMGVPQFNSLTRFFKLAFDPDIMSLTNTGRPKNILLRCLGKLLSVVGTVVFVMAFPLPSLIIWGMRSLNSYITRPTSKYYTLKPTMFHYWMTVESLLNHMAINRGFFPRNTWAADGAKTARQGRNIEMDSNTAKTLYEMMPSIFMADYGISIVNTITKSQRIYAVYEFEKHRLSKEGSDAQFLENLTKQQKQRMANEEMSMGALKSFSRWFSEWQGYSYNKESASETESDPKYDRSTGEQLMKAPDDFDAMRSAMYSQGMDWACLFVDSTGSSSVSFSNSVKDSDLSLKFNGTAQASREMKFNFAGGNVFDNPVGNLIESTLGLVGDVASMGAGWASGGLSNAIGGLTGGGFIDVPKHWDNSTVSLPTITYSRTLISPYNNPLSLLHNIDLYVCMLLAAALPRSTGKQSYGSPFLIQWYDIGRNQAKLGMMKELTIERGVGNLPFDSKGQALGVKVSFTLVDLSSIMHMPIASGEIMNPCDTAVDPAIDEDNILMDYLAVSAGMTLKQQAAETSKAEYNLARKIRNKTLLTSSGTWAMMTHDFVNTYLDLGLGNATSAFAGQMNRAR